MAEALWEPFANNLDRWLQALGPQVKLVRGYTPPEQEQKIIDTLAFRDPGALPWTSAEDSPYPDGLAATVFIPQAVMERAMRTSIQYGIKLDPDRPWHVEPLGLRGGAFEVPGVPKDKYFSNATNPEFLSAEDTVGNVLDTLFGKTHYADPEVLDSSSQLNQRRRPISTDARKFLRIMGDIASNDNYNAIDADTGAFGRWQIRPNDWNRWSSEVFGESVPLRTNQVGDLIVPSPQLQDRVATGMALRMFDQYKDWARVAGVWRGGESAANGVYPTEQSFINRFRNAWTLEKFSSSDSNGLPTSDVQEKSSNVEQDND